MKKVIFLACSSFLVTSCDTNKNSGEGKAVGVGEEGTVGGKAEKSEHELILDEWISKSSNTSLEPKERRIVLQQFGLDERIPVYDLVKYVTDSFPESDWFEIFFRRIRKEEKENILECLRVYPLLDKSKFAEGHCDRSFGIGAGEKAPLEGIEWCLKIEDLKRRSSAVYGLVAGLSKYAQVADYEEAKVVLKRALTCDLFPEYHKKNVAMSFFRRLSERKILKKDMLDDLDGLLSEEVMARFEKYFNEQ